MYYIVCGTRALGSIEPLVNSAARSALFRDTVALCNYQYIANFPTKHNIGFRTAIFIIHCNIFR